MAVKTNNSVNGYSYFRLTKTVGKRLNKNGAEIPIRKTFRGKTKKEAEEKYAAFMQRQQQGLEDKKQYFGIMADNWIQEFLANDQRLKNSTKDLYISTWRKHVKDSEIYHLPLDNVTAGVLQKFYNNLDCSASSLATINKVMSRFYKYLVTEGFATHNITASLVIKKAQRNDAEEITIWTDEELYAILHGFDKAQNGFRFRFLIVLALNTGCRIGELLGLKYSDIQDNCLKIRRQVADIAELQGVEKAKHTISTTDVKSSASRRSIPLNDATLQELEFHKTWQKQDMLKNGYRTEYIFTTDSGSLYDDRNVTRACERYYKRLGVEYKKFHTYRHTFGTLLCKKGVPIQTAAAIMGHSDINITAKYYVNVSAEEKAAAVNLLSGIM